MAEIKPPFIDNGEGLPTTDSVHRALEATQLSALADVEVSYGDPEGGKHTGTVVDLVGRCRIEHLVTDWPRGFMAHVIGAATQAANEGLKG